MTGYPTLRVVHLVVGLFVAAVLTAYGVSAVQMAYAPQIAAPRESTESMDIPPGHDETPRTLAAWLMTERDLRGDLTQASDDDGQITVTIDRPGTLHVVRYDRASGRADVTTRVRAPAGVLNRLHHLTGLTHDYWALSVAGGLLFAASIALLVLAVTGVTMWFLRHRERKTGLVVLVTGLAWGLTLLVMIRAGG
jgi:hypothetical protein